MVPSLIWKSQALQVTMFLQTTQCLRSTQMSQNQLHTTRKERIGQVLWDKMAECCWIWPFKVKSKWVTVLKSWELGSNSHKRKKKSEVWYGSICVIPILGRLRQENYESESSLGYIARLCLKTKEKTFGPVKRIYFIPHSTINVHT